MVMMSSRDIKWSFVAHAVCLVALVFPMLMLAVGNGLGLTWVYVKVDTSAGPIRKEILELPGMSSDPIYMNFDFALSTVSVMVKAEDEIFIHQYGEAMDTSSFDPTAFGKLLEPTLQKARGYVTTLRVLILAMLYVASCVAGAGFLLSICIHVTSNAHRVVITWAYGISLGIDVIALVLFLVLGRFWTISDSAAINGPNMYPSFPAILSIFIFLGLFTLVYCLYSSSRFFFHHHPCHSPRPSATGFTQLGQLELQQQDSVTLDPSELA